eukprot:Hpha_TRINITY_DN23423_c0_g1::TRINITY_DN23423_c0_g1_i1::g.113923::m.113923
MLRLVRVWRVLGFRRLSSTKSELLKGEGGEARPAAAKKEGGEVPAVVQPRRDGPTVDPNTAHATALARWDNYKEFVKNSWAPSPSKRRQDRIAKISREEKIRRSVEYGVWRPNDEMSLASGTRWEGFARDIMLPQRFTTAPALLARAGKNIFGVSMGVWLFMFSVIWETHEYVIDTMDEVNDGHMPNMGLFKGRDYDCGNMLYHANGQMPPRFPDLIEGEEHAEGYSAPPILRWTRILGTEDPVPDAEEFAYY